MLGIVGSHAAVKLGQSLFPLFALALDLPENFFDNKVLFLHPVQSGYAYLTEYGRLRSRLLSCAFSTIRPRLDPWTIGCKESGHIPSRWHPRHRGYHLLAACTSQRGPLY